MTTSAGGKRKLAFIVFGAAVTMLCWPTTLAGPPKCGTRYSIDVINDFLKASDLPPQVVGRTRVVNGKAAEPSSIPFVALIQLKRTVCSGSLISHYHVVTAAHCLCHAFGCKRQGSVDSFPSYVVHHLHVALGIAYRRQDAWRRVQAFAIHDSYSYSPKTETSEGNDVALLALTKKVNFDSRIQAICLPVKHFNVKTDTIVQIAGFGYKYEEEGDQSSCFTDQIGPSKIEHCGTSCKWSTYPSEYDVKKCSSTFNKAMSQLDLKANDVDAVEVDVHGSATRCYNPALFHDHGYCLDGDSKWGFCSRSCQFAGKERIDSLEYSTLKVVDKVDDEIHAAGILPIARVAFVKQKGDGTLTLEKTVQEKNSEKKYGYQDSCAGDSGGPLWTYMRHENDTSGEYRAVLLGATNAGLKICGYIDSFATYANIASPAVHRWIILKIGKNYDNVEISHGSRERAAPFLLTLCWWTLLHIL